MQLPPILHTIATALRPARLVVVGGFVRDYYLGYASKDYDIEVYNIASIEALKEALLPFGKVNAVGKVFGVLKFVHEGDEYDFSLPRQENKIGTGHRGFEVVCDAHLDFKEASRRRDFTINAMGFDIQTQRLLDPYNALSDLKRGTLRVVDKETFIEDALRLYRGVGFCARFGFKMEPKTQALCQQIAKQGMLNELSKERIFEEFNKILLKSAKPSIAFKLLNALGVEFRELANANFLLLDAIAPKTNNLKILYAAIDTPHIAQFLSRLSNSPKFIDEVATLSHFAQSSERNLKYLSTRVKLKELFVLWQDDGTLEAQAKREDIFDKPLQPLLQGRDLIALGLTPSPAFKTLLDRLYQAQIDDTIASKEEALAYLKLLV